MTNDPNQRQPVAEAGAAESARKVTNERTISKWHRPQVSLIDSQVRAKGKRIYQILETTPPDPIGPS